MVVTRERALDRLFENARCVFRRFALLIAALWTLAACGWELPKARVAGKARDARTLRPLAGVDIRWQDQRITTNADGTYAFTMPIGVQELRVSHQGVAFSSVVVVAHTKWKQGLQQEQDVLVPARVSKERAFSVSFLAADFKDFEKRVGSGVLVTNADGGDAEFLRLDSPPAQLPHWDETGTLLYVADVEAKGRTWRHDTTTNTTSAVMCSGFVPSGVNALCIAPDGDTGLVSTNDQTLILRHLNGACTAHPLPGFMPAIPARCAFDGAGQVYVVARVAARTATRNQGQLHVIDTRAPTPTPRAVEWLKTWNVNHPVVLADGRLLLERTNAAGELETGVVSLITETFDALSNTGSPVQLKGDRLYYIANERALRVRLLDSGREATLVNGAEFAIPVRQ